MIQTRCCFHIRRRVLFLRSDETRNVPRMVTGHSGHADRKRGRKVGEREEMERGDCVEGGGAVSRTVSCCQDDEWMPAPAVRALMGAAALYIIHTPLCERLLTALKSATETHKSTQNTHTSSPSGGGAAQVRTGRPLAKRVAGSCGTHPSSAPRQNKVTVTPKRDRLLHYFLSMFGHVTLSRAPAWVT